MAYIYDDASGRIAAIVLQGTPTPPSGFTLTSDAVEDEDIIDSKRNIGTGLIQKRDALKISGSNGVAAGTVGSVVVQKIDGVTQADLTDPSDDDAIAVKVENDAAFLEKESDNLVNGAASVKIAAPSVADQSRFLVLSDELQLLDSEVIFS